MPFHIRNDKGLFIPVRFRGLFSEAVFQRLLLACDELPEGPRKKAAKLGRKRL